MQKTLIKIIYASTSGNTELVCDYITKLLEKSGFETRLFRSEKTPIKEITNHDKFILATSTYEHGVINPFYDKLLSEMQTTDLKGKFAGIIGLGDTRYELHLFCEGANILKKAFMDQGGTILHQPLKINGEPHDQLDIVDDWTRYFITALKDAVK